MHGFSGTTSFFRNGRILAMTLIPSDDCGEFCVGVTFSSSSVVKSGYILVGVKFTLFSMARGLQEIQRNSLMNLL